jgi:beta-xylosidase
MYIESVARKKKTTLPMSSAGSTNETTNVAKIKLARAKVLHAPWSDREGFVIIKSRDGL